MTENTYTTIPAMDDDRQVADELEPGVDVIYNGARYTVSEVTRRAIKFEDGGGARFQLLADEGMDIIVDEETDDDDDEEGEDDDDTIKSEIESHAGSTVQMTCVPSTHAQEESGAERERVTGTLVGVREMDTLLDEPFEKIAIETGDGDVRTAALSAWDAEIDDDADSSQIAVAPIDADDDHEEVEMIVAGATERADNERYCRVTVDDKRVAVTDVTQTADGLELYEDGEVVMRLAVSEGSGRATNAIWDAIENRTGSRVTLTGSLTDWDGERTHVSDSDE